MTLLPVGKGECLREGENVAILTIGHVGNTALKAADKVYTEKGKMAGVYNMRWVKPIDTELVQNIAKSYKTIITVEDGILAGGFGSAVLETLQGTQFSGKVIRLGIDDAFVPHGTQQELYKMCGIDFDGIVTCIENEME